MAEQESNLTGVRKQHDNGEYTDDQRAKCDLDFLDRKADLWMEETGVQRMLDAISSAFHAGTNQELSGRFRVQIATIAHQCFVEGAMRAWNDIAEQGGLIRIVKAENDG